jgi:hypothetical protein
MRSAGSLMSALVINGAWPSCPIGIDGSAQSWKPARFCLLAEIEVFAALVGNRLEPRFRDRLKHAAMRQHTPKAANVRLKGQLPRRDNEVVEVGVLRVVLLPKKGGGRSVHQDWVFYATEPAGARPNAGSRRQS